MSDLPLISLVMIVKNEARSIQKVIESCAPWVDRYDILDTGSTDDTVAIIRNTCEKLNLPGNVYEEPFVNFAVSRNRSLDLAKPHSVFSLQASGDEFLYDGKSLREFCKLMQAESGIGHGAYYIEIRYDKLGTLSPRLVRNCDNWRWVGAVHEVLCKEGELVPQLTAPKAYLLHTNADQDRKRLRLYKDVELLREETRRDPKDPKNSRALFYLAQTLEELGFTREAVETYKLRIDIPVGNQEIYVARLRLARASLRVGQSWPFVQHILLENHQFMPNRAESLFEIANYWHVKGSHELTYMFAHEASKIPPPFDGLFVELDVYELKIPALISQHAFYVKAYKEGREATEKLMKLEPSNQLHKSNYAFYAARVTK